MFLPRTEIRNKPPMAPHGLILSENEAIPTMVLFILPLGLYQPIVHAFLMQSRPQWSGTRKLAKFLFSLYPLKGLFRLIWSLEDLLRLIWCEEGGVALLQGGAPARVWGRGPGPGPLFRQAWTTF